MAMNGKSAHALERETEATRERLVSALDELRMTVSHNLSAAGLMEQATDYLRTSGGAEFARNLGEKVRDNPVPVALAGIGIAWLAMSSPGRNRVGYSTGSGQMRRTVAGAAGMARDAVSAVGEGVSSVAQAVRDGASAIRDKAAGASESVRGSAAYVSGRASEYGDRFGDTMSDVSQRTRATGQNAGENMHRWGSSTANGLTTAFKEHPVLFGVLGLALGAAIAASLPTTQAEEEAVGDATDKIRERAEEFAEEQYDELRSTVAEAADKAAEMTKPQESTSGASGLP